MSCILLPYEHHDAVAHILLAGGVITQNELRDTFERLARDNAAAYADRYADNADAMRDVERFARRLNGYVMYAGPAVERAVSDNHVAAVDSWRYQTSDHPRFEALESAELTKVWLAGKSCGSDFSGRYVSRLTLWLWSVGQLSLNAERDAIDRRYARKERRRLKREAA